MHVRTRFMAIVIAFVCTAIAAGAAQSAKKDDGKKDGTTVSGATKATGTAVGDAAKTTGKKTATVAKATGSTTKKGAKATGKATASGAKTTAGGAKKLGAGIKSTVTGDDKDKEKKDGKK